MKIFLPILLSLSLQATTYQCKDSKLVVTPEAITEITKQGELEYPMRKKEWIGYCHDTKAPDGRERYTCIEKDGSTFKFITSWGDKWEETCSAKEHYKCATTAVYVLGAPVVSKSKNNLTTKDYYIVMAIDGETITTDGMFPYEAKKRGSNQSNLLAKLEKVMGEMYKSEYKGDEGISIIWKQKDGDLEIRYKRAAVSSFHCIPDKNKRD